MKLLAQLFTLVLDVIGLGLAIAGTWLIALGGSAYYLIAGLAYLLAGGAMFKRPSGGRHDRNPA